MAAGGVATWPVNHCHPAPRGWRAMAAGRDRRGGASGARGWGRLLCVLALHCVWCVNLTAGLPVPGPRYSLKPPRRNETLLIHFSPPAVHSLTVHSRQTVSFSCSAIRRYTPPNHTARHDTTTTSSTITPALTTTASSTTSDSFSTISPNLTTSTTTSSDSSSSGENSTATAAWSQHSVSSGSYWALIYSSDSQIAVPVLSSWPLVPGAGGWSGGVSTNGGGGGAGVSGGLLMAVRLEEANNVTIQGLHVGRVTMNVAVLDRDAASLMADNGHLPDSTLIQTTGANFSLQAVAASEFPVTTVRGQRTADLVFDSSAAAISILITFGIGCCTDTDSVKKQLKFPVSLIIGFCCQFILMPVLAFGLAMILPLDKDIRFGLLCTACVPGGGLGHIAVIIGDADIPLSLTLNMISVVAMLGTAPLWIFVLGQYFQTDPNAILSPRIIPIYNFEIWLASIFIAYATGLLLNRFRPVLADILLTWVIKPLMLLATILYITVGVYINMYVFELINNYAVLGAILLPLVGCVLGCTLAALCRQRASFIKTIMLETSSLNCLIVLAALRFSLKQPDADLASMIPIWVMFTIPGLYVALAILQKVKRTGVEYWRNRNSADKEDKDYEVASAIVNRPGMAALSAPLVVADGATDDEAANNEKVTVL